MEGNNFFSFSELIYIESLVSLSLSLSLNFNTIGPLILPASHGERFGGDHGRRQMKGEVGAPDWMSEK